MVSLARRRGRPIARLSISITGIVQGVGFRPFIYRLASEMDLTGWVRNGTEGVLIEACSTDERLAHFIRRIKAEAPPLAVIASLEHHSLPDDCLSSTSPSAKAVQAEGILHRSPRMPPSVQIACGNFSILQTDASVTRSSPAPTAARATASSPGSPTTVPTRPWPPFRSALIAVRNTMTRRTGAFTPSRSPARSAGRRSDCSIQPVRSFLKNDQAIITAIELLKAGKILAVKGIGGYHLAADACNGEAVRCLRERKKRDEKPFAVMAPDLAAARAMAQLSSVEERLLASPESPIVIVRRATRLSGLTADCPTK